MLFKFAHTITLCHALFAPRPSRIPLPVHLYKKTMPTYKEYMQQIEHLTVLAEAARAEELKTAKDQVLQIMRDYGMSPADLMDSAKSGPKRKHPPSTVLYKDPDSNKTWTGRGRMPSWLEGKNREDLLVK